MIRRRNAHPTSARATLGVLALALACAGSDAGPGAPDLPAPDGRAESLLARRALEDGRRLQVEGRLDAAARVLERGLARRPRDPELLRALGHVRSAQDRDADAASLHAAADAVDPPPPPLPETPQATAAGATLVLLVPSGDALRPDEPGHWPDDAALRGIARHLARRLPGAEILRADPASVAEAGRMLAERNAVRALSLRVERADCRFSIKDGAIAVAELRAAAAIRGEATGAPVRTKVVERDPPAEDCTAPALGRALEQVLSGDAWERIAATAPAPSSRGWEEAARGLFPGIGRRIAEQLRHGESLLRAGQLGAALRAFEEARALDPGDPEVLAHLDDTQKSLALARQLAARSASPDDPERLDPRLSPAQRAAAEVALARERQRREELLSALAVLDEDLRALPEYALARLRPVEIREAGAFGATLARRRADGAIEARVAYAPDGSELARYYFPVGASTPLLREEDTDGDGAPDRWIAYRDGARGEIFEDGRGRGRPDRRLVFAEGGEPLLRIELDLAGDARPERVFRYEAGTLRAEASDTDGDGRLDRFDRFGDGGQVDLREEDLDGDGEIDVRSVYRGGKLVRREVSSPEYVPES